MIFFFFFFFFQAEDGIRDYKVTGVQTCALPISFDEKTDLKGPVSLAAVATKPQGENKKSRLVVYGNSAFASNGAYGLQGNGNLFLNTVSWLAQDENFISIRPKSPDDRRITMTEAQGRFVNYVLVLLLPVGIIGAGIRVWVRRRK